MQTGVEIVLVHKPGLPIFSARLVLSRGPRDVRGTRPEAIAMGIRALLSADPDALELGASGGCMPEGCSLSTSGPLEQLDASIALLGDLAVSPPYNKVWATKEAQRARDAWFEAPGGGAVDDNMAALLFAPGDAYAPLPVGAEKAVAETSATTLYEVHEQIFQPEHATLVVAGDVEMDRLKTTAQLVFGPWSRRVPELPRRTDEPAPAPPDARAAHIDRRGILVHGYLSARGPVAGDPDLDALSLLIAVLGAPKGRLHDAVRSGLGAVYSFDTKWEVGRTASWMAIGGPFELEKAQPAMMAVATALRAARDSGLPAAEIEGARSRLISALRERLSTTRGITRLLAESLAQGRPAEDALAQQARLAAVTPADIQRAARKWLAEDRLRLVLVGPEKYLLLGFEKLGVGPLKWRSFRGELLR
ncbi:MAG: insulinase family protein [Polyangiaceae bacterium]